MEIKVTLNTPMPVLGDWDELVQVVQNLVENAIKYASAGGRVDITGHCDGKHAELSVRDYGPGIQEEHIPRLTERFYRVSVQESRSRGGTGLGLAIVKHILNRHRGRLVVRSELGSGSSFAIRVPLASNGYGQ
jgi:two-component system phosphate regulon sensor histidine kinase PhoR